MTLDGSLADNDATFDRFHESGAAPGCAFGVIVDGELVNRGGRGTLRAGAATEPHGRRVPMTLEVRPRGLTAADR